MSIFSPAQGSDINAVIGSVVTNKIKIQQLTEDNKEAIAAIVKKYEGLIDKKDIADFIKWELAPERLHEDQESIEERATKYAELKAQKTRFKTIDSRPMELEDLD